MTKKRISLWQNKEIEDKRMKKEITRKMVITKEIKKKGKEINNKRQMMSFCCEAVQSGTNVSEEPAASIFRAQETVQPSALKTRQHVPAKGSYLPTYQTT